MIEQIGELLRTYLHLSIELQSQLFMSLLVLVLLWAVRLVALRLVHRQFSGNARMEYNGRKVTHYTTVLLGVFLIGRIWLEGIQSLATYLGLLSAGVAIALQDLIVNLAGWGYIVWQRPFKVGDRIELGDTAGDVIDVGLLEFSMLEIGRRIQAEQSTGRIIHIPNGKIFKENLANAHQGIPFIWNEIPVLITFESDWQKAKTILTDIIQRYAPDTSRSLAEYARRPDRRFVINFANTEPVVYTSVVNSGVLLTMRYLVQPRKRRDSEQLIWEAVLRAFAPLSDVDFAYDTVREFSHWREGKAPTTPPPPPVSGQYPFIAPEPRLIDDEAED